MTILTYVDIWKDWHKNCIGITTEHHIKQLPLRLLNLTNIDVHTVTVV